MDAMIEQQLDILHLLRAECNVGRPTRVQDHPTIRRKHVHARGPAPSQLHCQRDLVLLRWGTGPVDGREDSERRSRNLHFQVNIMWYRMLI